MQQMKYRVRGIVNLFIVILLSGVLVVKAEAAPIQEENKIYDSLNEKIKNNFYEGIDSVKEAPPIEVSGNLFERIIRSIANALYQNLDEIKAGSLLAGTISFLSGLTIFKVVKLNKGIRRYALSVFMITIPLVLFIFVIACSFFIDIFI